MSQSIHLAVTRKVKPGHERDFEKQLSDFAQRSLAESGTRGVHLIFPAPGSGSNEYGILRSFASAKDREDFYKSCLYGEWLRTIEPWVEGEPEYRELNGLEAWFRNAKIGNPPTWKMAIATYLGVVPVIMFLTLTLGRVLQNWNFVLSNIVFNAFVVVLLTWVVMPIITRALESWLRSAS